MARKIDLHTEFSSKFVFWSVIISVNNILCYISRWQTIVEEKSPNISVLKIECIIIFLSIFLAAGAFFITNATVVAILENNKSQYIPVIQIVVLSIFEFSQLQISYLHSIISIGETCFVALIINTCILFSINLLVVLVFKNKSQILLITIAVLCTIWSFANVLIMYYRGTPLYFNDIKLLETAMSVANGYNISIGLNTIIPFLFIIAELFIITRKERITGKEGNGKNSLLYMALITIVVSIIASHVYVPLYVWKDKRAIGRYGAIVRIIDQEVKSRHPYNKPAGYSDNFEYTSYAKKATINNKKPNIILIQNESFCDLTECTEIKTDVDYLKNFRSIDGAVYGKAVVPNIACGTNDSEYELLTSNSMYMLNAGAPFITIDADKYQNSLVSYLNKLNYHTVGMHDRSGNNYNRRNGYRALGFDEVLLGEGFYNIKYNGNRVATDEGDYEDMIKYLNKNKPRNQSQFAFLLTYQNHGGYYQNDDSMDTVHVISKSFKKSELNECLSSIKLSGDAFKKLTEYYSNEKEPTIICMVGDHIPELITNIEFKNEDNKYRKELDQRTVPYVLWSNFDADFSECTEYVSMMDLAPIILKSAGLPLSDYYNTILKLHKEFPVKMSNGLVMDSKGKIYNIKDNKKTYKAMQEYFYMEYNSLLNNSRTRKEIFEP